MTAAATRDDAACCKAAVADLALRAAVQRYGARLRAVVLAGSLAREEATFVRADACWKALGDADFFLVFHQGSALPEDGEIAWLAAEIERALGGRGILMRVGLAAVPPSYLETSPPHIGPYELRECGSVIWGDREVLKLIPGFTAAQISLEDAWRLLANRLIEQLEDLIGAEQDVYRTVKLYLDMAASYLVFAGRYAPAYGARAQEIARLAASDADTDAPFNLQDFAQEVDACTRFKLGEPDLSCVASLSKALGFARRLWRWELENLTGAGGERVPRELMRLWMKRQSWRERLRGWASVVRRCGMRRSWRQWPRWLGLGLQASPRYWVYLVAAELLFEKEQDWTATARRLPWTEAQRPGGQPTWRWAAEETVLNYRRFLETTRA